MQRDLILEAGELPTHFSYHLNGAGTSRSGSDAFSQNIGVAVAGRYSFAGAGDASSFVVGGGLVANQASYQSLGHYTGYGLQVSGGYGWAVTDSWSVGGRVLLGYGLATFDLQSNPAFPTASPAPAPRSPMAPWSTIDYTITEKLTVLLDLGYQQTSANLSGGGVTLKLKLSGLRLRRPRSASPTALLRLAPRPLE